MEPAVTCSVAILAESADAQALLQHTRQMLDSFEVPCVERMIRDRAGLRDLVSELESAGANVFIVGSTTPNPLTANVAGITLKPILAVPFEGHSSGGLWDLLLATTSEGGVAGTLAIGKAGAINAALLAVAILSSTNADLRGKLERFRQEQTAKVLAEKLG
jgi:5-(carboxyamino)imidazole ribonucleotide mutase